MMEIRLMTIDDYEAAFSLWTSTPGVGMRSLDDSREGIARYLARNPTSCFVAAEAGEVVGTILCGHDGRRGYIYHAMVANAHRRRGIGKLLIEAGLDALRAEGVTRAALVAFRDNEKGNAFWEAMGFSRRDDLNYWNLGLDERNV